MDEEPDSDEIGSIPQSVEALRLSKGQERVLTPDDQAWIEAAEKNTRLLESRAAKYQQSVPKEERERLHFILDALLNEREYLEKFTAGADEGTGEQFYHVGVEPARTLHMNASRFLKEILGEEVRSLALGAGRTDLEWFAQSVGA